MKHVDVLIVGGGPAGLSAGIVLARNGLNVLVCEKKAFPVDKACGEGIMPTGVKHLEALGVLSLLDTDEVFPFVGIRYDAPKGHSAEAMFAEGPGLGIRRLALSQAFLRCAKTFKNLEIYDCSCVTAFTRKENRIEVDLGKQKIQTRLLIGADGLNSIVKRWANLEVPPLKSNRRWGARQHFHIAPWSNFVEVIWKPGIEAYITPCSKTQIGIAFLWHEERYREVQGGPRLIPSLMKAFPKLQERLSGVCPASQPRAIGPFYHESRSPVSQGVVLIGDASGYLDAITGEGISLATAQALCLEKNIVPLFRSQRASSTLFTVPELSGYTHAHRAIVRPYYRVTRLVLLLNRYPALANHVIYALKKHPDIFQHFLSANMGLVSPWAMSFKQMARFLKTTLGETILNLPCLQGIF